MCFWWSERALKDFVMGSLKPLKQKQGQWVTIRRRVCVYTDLSCFRQGTVFLMQVPLSGSTSSTITNGASSSVTMDRWSSSRFSVPEYSSKRGHTWYFMLREPFSHLPTCTHTHTHVDISHVTRQRDSKTNSRRYFTFSICTITSRVLLCPTVCPCPAGWSPVWGASDTRPHWRRDYGPRTSRSSDTCQTHTHIWDAQHPLTHTHVILSHTSGHTAEALLETIMKNNTINNNNNNTDNNIHN